MLALTIPVVLRLVGVAVVEMSVLRELTSLDSVDRPVTKLVKVDLTVWLTTVDMPVAIVMVDLAVLEARSVGCVDRIVGPIVDIRVGDKLDTVGLEVFCVENILDNKLGVFVIKTLVRVCAVDA